MILPRKYNDAELQYILEVTPQMPVTLTEHLFIRDVQSNKKIKWRVNHFLFKKNLLQLILDHQSFKKWKFLKLLNWILILFIISFSMYVGNYKILFFVIVFPFLIITVDHWIFILNLVILTGIKSFFNINIQYFWFFVTIIVAGYVLNKANDEMIERKIIRQGLNTWETFWKYYSNELIWIDRTALNNEYKILIEKYPELQSL